MTPTTPDTFKSLILAQHPDGVASDGRKYADIPAQELTQMVVSKYPDGVTNDGRKYADFLNNTQTGQSEKGGFIKSLISAPLTILARPIQAGAELLGASEQQVNDLTRKLTGGLVAPVPTNVSDLKKDVGRAIQTVSLGAGGLASAGAGLGLGSSLEQGNDLFSGQTAFQTVLGASSAKVLGLIGEPIFNATGKAIGKITPQFLSDIASQGTKAIEDFAAQHNILPEKVSNVINTGAKTTENLVNKPFSALKSGSEYIANKVSNLGKTEAEILATPVEKLSSLSPQERKIYYDNQIAITKAGHGEMMNSLIAKQNAQEAKIENDLTNKLNLAQEKAINLKRKIDTASRDETLNLRPQAIKAFQEQSQVYRKLVDEEIAPYVDTKVNNSEVNNFIDTRFSDNPEQAQAIKNVLGLKETLTLPPVEKGGIPTIQSGQETTIGELYNKSKLLSQDIGMAAKKGTRVYTPEEKLTDDAIHTLTDFMKTKGIDLVKPRKFWAQYAPIRNEIISKLKPFNYAGTQTGTFARTLIKVSSGRDVNNENFIKEFENLLGKPIGTEAKNLLAKLTLNEKYQIATKLEAEAKLANLKQKTNLAKTDIKNKTSASISALKSQEYEVQREAQRKANLRKIFINAIKYTIGGIAGEKLLKSLGIPYLP